MAASVRSYARNGASGTTASVTLPTHAAGDVLVLVLLGYVSFSTPSGWTSRGSLGPFAHPFGADGFAQLFTKVAASASETNPSSTHGKSDQWEAQVYVVQGADTTTVIDAGPSFVRVGGGVLPRGPSISPTGTDSLLLVSGGVYPSSSASGNTFTAPTGMTLRGNASGNGTWNAFAAATQELAASGATGTKTFGMSGNVGDDVGVSIAILSGGATAPATPTGLAVVGEPRATEVDMSWNASTGATSSKVTVTGP